MRGVAVGIVAAWAAALLELLVVGVAVRAQFASGWEIENGALLLAPTALIASVPCALAGAALVRALAQRSPASRAGVAVAAFAAAGTATFFVTTGRHFGAVGPRAFAVGIAGLLVALVAWTTAPASGRWLARDPARFAVFAAAAFAVLELGNRFLLVRLYAPFHVALAVAALVAAAVSGVAVARAPGNTNPRRTSLLVLAPVALLVAAAAFAVPAAAKLSRFDNFRLLLADDAPVLGQAVRLAAALAPPPPMDAGDPCLLDPSTCASAHAASDGLRLDGRDIVLVTIDALRADHVGAYGYARNTTPEIDRIAADSVVFERAYCPTPHTSYSVTSLMTGKYMRPLLLQGTGQDSETFATFLRTYGYKTAAFYPPAVFFIDESRFESFEHSHFGFEYRKVEFLEGQGRAAQVEQYLGRLTKDQRLFLWVHSFAPHEPYEAHPDHPFGDRDVDRYDSEIAFSDAMVGRVVRSVRALRPNAVVIVTADHGEEFGDHGGRYHGTSVYEEQVRVPLLVSAPGLLAPRRVTEVVQTIDLLPTILAGLAIPPSPRIRGRNLGPILNKSRPEEPGFAYTETDDDALLAEGTERLICARKLGACRLYDLGADPGEHEDVSAARPDRFAQMRTELQAFGASHGRFELQGARAETGHGWPPPILRGIAGDADAAPDLVALLDDSDKAIRQKAAELLFKLRRPESLPGLRLAFGRDEDPTVRRWCALALTRLGETVPLTTDLLHDPDPKWSRLGALVLAESGDARGGPVLVDFWQHGGHADHEQALDILAALGKIRDKDAVWPFVQTLHDVRLRPRIADALADIGDDAARGPLVSALSDERSQTARIAIANALVRLGAKDELLRPLIRFLGVPDPLPGGLGYAEHAGLLESVGGPTSKGLAALTAQSSVGVRIDVVVPKAGNGTGTRVIVRAKADGAGGEVRVGRAANGIMCDSKGHTVTTREVPRIHDRDFVSLVVPGGGKTVEVSAVLPASIGARAGSSVELVVFAEAPVHLEALAVVPLAAELPPPPPEPWTPQPSDDTQ